MEFFLLAFPALFSIINPLGGAFVFLTATQRLQGAMREQMARWIAIYSAIILIISFYVGGYVLSFFGISMPVLRVAGGIILTMAGFRMLNQGDDVEERKGVVEEAASYDARRHAFFPLTLPITAGPGTISVAIALGTKRQPGLDYGFALSSVLTVLVMCTLIYVLYRFADRISLAIGETGTTVVARLMAFILFCIGIEVLWSGARELLESLIL